ncbi:STAS domain-containing protein [Kitasatospora sp. NPDC048545]|uniref:STAS domain-containing protein n=1 Tax=Kitasatospora sp. NPDC048545 TaxID=3157208 RepID=UPI00340F130B
MSTRHDTSEVITPTTALLRIAATDLPGSALVLHLHGEVDRDQRAVLEDALTRAVKDCPPRLIVDLAGLSFCDSTGLNALLATRLEAQANSVRLTLAAPPPQLRRLLEITGGDEIFTIRDTVRAALDEATGPGAE